MNYCGLVISLIVIVIIETDYVISTFSFTVVDEERRYKTSRKFSGKSTECHYCPWLEAGSVFVSGS